MLYLAAGSAFRGVYGFQMACSGSIDVTSSRLRVNWGPVLSDSTTGPAIVRDALPPSVTLRVDEERIETDGTNGTNASRCFE